MTRIRTPARRGSAVLEAALVFPVLLYLAMGCVEFGQYFYLKHTLQGAAREGARAAATGTTALEVTNAVRYAMDAAGIGVSKYTVTVTDTTTPTPLPIVVTATTPTPGTAIVVKVTANWSVVGTRGMGFIGSAKQVSGSTTMRREG